MTALSHTPYTYLIGWSKLDRWYYGSETSSKQKIAHPDNLWKIYFTSSRYVKKFRELHGEPDVIEIRKIFSDPQKALYFESKILKRLGCVKSDRWLNRTDNQGIPLEFNGGKNSAKISREKKLGMFSWTLDDRQRFNAEFDIPRKGGRVGGRKNYENKTGLFGMSSEDSQRSKINGGKARGKITGKYKWIFDPLTLKNKRVPSSQLSEFLNCGWKLGYIREGPQK